MRGDEAGEGRGERGEGRREKGEGRKHRNFLTHRAGILGR
jgi:hypothetical protein